MNSWAMVEPRLAVRRRGGPAEHSPIERKRSVANSWWKTSRRRSIITVECTSACGTALCPWTMSVISGSDRRTENVDTVRGNRIDPSARVVPG